MSRRVLIIFLVFLFVLSPYSFLLPLENFSKAETIIHYKNIAADTTWDLSGSPYVICMDDITISEGATLTIEPGVIVKLAQKSIIVMGKLNVQGEVDDPVVFTSANDDARGGKSVEWSSGLPEAGDWGSIVTEGGELTINQAIINYGGLGETIEVLKNNLFHLNTALANSYYNTGAVAVGFFGGKINISNSEIANNNIGVLVREHEYDYENQNIISNSRIFNNNLGGVLNYGTSQIQATNNWWGSNTGPHNLNFNPNGQGDEVDDNVSFDPWIGKNCNHAPAIELYDQYKSDGITVLSETSPTAGNSIFIKAKVNDQDNDPVRIEVELKKYPGNFYLSDTVFSQYTIAGSEAKVMIKDLEDEQYHWRVRAVDENGAASDWHYGVGGILNLTYDFEVKTVPLYTQVESDHPSKELTDSWYDQNYAFGTATYSCSIGEIAKISKCGCAITSMVMLGKYYGINEDISGNDVNPLNINTWLNQNSGYTSYGGLYWGKSIEYLGFKENNTTKVRLSLDYYNATPGKHGDVIDSYILNNKPAVAYSNAFGHYFVIDNKTALNTDGGFFTYGIKDPYWYNTKTLDEKRDISGKVQSYHNIFSKANLFSYLAAPKKIAASLDIRIASPAELVVTDPQGRRLGKDPVSGEEYNEIPGAVYTLENDIITSDDELDQNSVHQSKITYFPEPIDGVYNIQVIGTGEGGYLLSTLAYDQNGVSKTNSEEGQTAVGLKQQYNLSFNQDDAASIDLKPQDTIAPEAQIFFDTENKKIAIIGTDNFTAVPTVVAAENCIFTLLKRCLAKEYVYTIADEAGNTLKLWLDKNENEHTAMASIKKVQYNEDNRTEKRINVLYIWQKNKTDNGLKFLSQTITDFKTLKLKAIYYDNNDKTTIFERNADGQKINAARDGVAIVKILTNKGKFEYEY